VVYAARKYWHIPSMSSQSSGIPRQPKEKATSYDSDTQGATATRAKLFAEWADQPALVIGTHYAAPTTGQVKRDGAAFRFEV
jgi:hypothetical protein